MNDTNSGPVQTGNKSTHVNALSGLQIELRDWFAGMAMQGILSAERDPEAFDYFDGRTTHAEWVPQTALEIADAMLAARKENQ